jgi:hypothetical protein
MLVLVVVPGLGHGATIRVRKDGTGNYSTIQAAVNAMAARDTVIVGPGDYQERITFPSGKSGVTGSLTTLIAETQGTVETLGFDTGNCNYLRIQGFNVSVPTSSSNPGFAIRSSRCEIVSNYVHDVPSMGIRGYQPYSFNHLLGNRIYNVGMGIFFYGTNWVVEANEIERLHYYAPLGDADYIIFFGEYHLMSNNYLHGTLEAEIGPAHVDGFSSWDNNGEYIHHIRIEGNRMDSFYHQGFICQAMHYTNSYDVVICNNIFKGASTWGVDAFGSLKDVKVYNNLFIDINSLGVGINQGATGEVYNNIFYNVSGWDSDTSRSIGSKNIWYRPGVTLSARFTGDFVNVNPQFVDVANGDYRLKSTSPAIDAGMANTNCTFDIAGLARPQGGGWDIGLYEYVSSLPDTIAPVISAISANVVSNTAVAINWNTSELANSRVEYGPNVSYGLVVSNNTMALQRQIVLTNLTAGATYHYRVRSADAVGNVTTSGDLTFVVTPTAPGIASQPQGRTNFAGTTVSFSVTATGTPPLAYQWRFNGAGIVNNSQFSGATSSALTILNAQQANAGNYTVVVTNSGGAITSQVALLAVLLPGSCQPAPSGLVGWWSGDGSAVDLVGTNNGTLQGGASANLQGYVANGFTFNGSSSYVQIPDAPSLRPTNLTIEAWVLFTDLESTGSGGSPAGSQYIVFKQNPNNSNFEGYALTKTRLPTGDVFSFGVASSSGQEVSATGTTLLSTGVWYHVAGVRGPDYLQLFVNGQLQSQTPVSFAQSYGTLPLFFGTSGQSFWDHKLNGRLDEVSLYNRALSAGEISAIYAAGVAGKCKGAGGSDARFLAPVVLNGSLKLTLSGEIGRSYRLLASTNLLNWSQVATITLTNGPVSTNLPMNWSRRFYRAQLVP